MSELRGRDGFAVMDEVGSWPPQLPPGPQAIRDSIMEPIDASLAMKAMRDFIAEMRRGGIVGRHYYCRAPKRKRPRRIAKKLKQRGGFLHYPGFTCEVRI